MPGAGYRPSARRDLAAATGTTQDERNDFIGMGGRRRSPATRTGRSHGGPKESETGTYHRKDTGSPPADPPSQFSAVASDKTRPSFLSWSMRFRLTQLFFKYSDKWPYNIVFCHT